MKYIVFVFSLLIGMSAFASIDTSGLSKEQAAQLAAQAEEMRSTVVVSKSESIRKEAEAWGELGTNIGKAMVGAAAEVGVAAAEFSETPLGKVVTFVAVYKIVGADIIGIIVGLLVISIGLSFGIWMIRSRQWHSATYENRPVLWGLYNKRSIVTIEVDSDTVGAQFLIGSLAIIAGLLVGLACIF